MTAPVSPEAEEQPMTTPENRPKNREIEDEMIRRPAPQHVPPRPATEPAKGDAPAKT